MSDDLFGNPDNTDNKVSPESTSVQEPAQGQQENQAQTPPTDPNSLFADRLASITAEDGRQKYADVSTALDSIPHAQAKIQEQAQELQRLQEELQQRKRIEEMLERIENTNVSQEPTSPDNVLDVSTVDQLLEQKLQQAKQAEIMESNRQSVVSSLTEKYGEKAEEVFAKRASELGMDVAGLSELALRHPKVVLSQFEQVQASPTSNPVQGSVNTDGVAPKPPERKPVAYGATTKDVVEQFRAHAPQ